MLQASRGRKKTGEPAGGSHIAGRTSGIFDGLVVLCLVCLYCKIDEHSRELDVGPGRVPVLIEIERWA